MVEQHPPNQETRPRAVTDEDLLKRLTDERRRRVAAETAVSALKAELDVERRERQRLARELRVLEGRAARLLSPGKPVDHLRLLWWVLVRPDQLKAYRADLTYREAERLQRHSSWLVSSLLWFPVLLLFCIPWLLGALEISLAGAAMMLLGIGFSWLLTGVLGTHESPFSALAAVMMTTIMTLCVTALIAFFIAGPGRLMLLLGGAVLLLVVTAVPAAKILHLTVGSTVAHVVAVVIGGGILIFMADHAQKVWDVIALVGVAVVVMPVVEMRYKQAGW